MAQSATSSQSEKVHNQTWSSPVTFASPWKGIVGGASSQSRSLTSASSVIVNSQDTLEWPPIGETEDIPASQLQHHPSVSSETVNTSTAAISSMTTTADTANTTSSHQESILAGHSLNQNNSASSESCSVSSMAAINSQSSLGGSTSLLGAPLSSRSSDLTTSSNSVINNSSSSANSVQVGDSQWLENSIGGGGWDKQIGSQPGTPRLDHPANSASQFAGWGQATSFSSFGGGDATGTSKWGASPSTSNLSSNSMQSAWGSQSPSLNRQQSSTDSWGMPSAMPPQQNSMTGTTQWGLPSATTSTRNNPDQQDSWGQPKQLPNAGTDGWGQQVTSAGGQSNPSSANAAHMSQWGQPASYPSSSAWPSTNSGDTAQRTQPLPVSSQAGSAVTSGADMSGAMSDSPTTSASAVTQQSQWGATTSAGGQLPQADIAITSPASSISGGMASPNKDSTGTPTSWAGAAAKGLPKALPKPPEPVDPVKLAIEQTINNPEGWGRVPVRQDTTWGKPPEKKKQDDSNQWQAAPNNGTAIWEAVKSTQGQAPKFEDKSTWNQKVAGNNDPNVWNGEGSKGKDNALWDNVPSTKESEPVDQTNQWNAGAPQTRTISQSSAGDNASSDGGWNAGVSAPIAGVTRASPPNPINSQPTMSNEPNNWGAQNGSVDPRKLNRWESNPGPGPGTGPGPSHPMRMNSMNDSELVVDNQDNGMVDILQQTSRTLLGQPATQPPLSTAVTGGSTNAVVSSIQQNIIQPPSSSTSRGSSYWDGPGQNRPVSGGGPSNWNSKPPGGWPNDNGPGPSGGSGWGGQSQPQSNQGGWGDGPPSGNQWNSSGQAPPSRKTSFTWEDNQNSGGNEFGRDRRQFKSESDATYDGNDADMGDWNESNSVWSSANGFKNPRKHAPIPENHIPPHMQPNRGGGGMMGGGGGQFNPGPPGGMAPGMGGNHSAHGGGAGGNMNSGGNLTKQQMLGILVNQMKFPKDEAHSALINNDMNLQGAISELMSRGGGGGGGGGNNMQQQPPLGLGMGGMPGGPIGDNAFNPNIPPPNLPSNLNTPFNNNAQHNQPAGLQGSSRKPTPQRAPIGRGGGGNSVQQHQQRLIVQQLQLGVKMNNIHPQILNLPLTDQTLRSIQQLLNLQQTYQHHHDQLMQLQRRGGPANGPQYESLNQTLMGINQQMRNIQQPLINQHQMPKMSGGGVGGISDGLSGMSLSQSRLGIWTDKAPGSTRQGANMGPSLHSSHSTPNLQGGGGGGLGDHNPWSSSSSGHAGGSMWSSNISPSSGGQFGDSHNESQSANPSSAGNPGGESFDIPEFVPGQPWQGVNNSKVEDDPNITPGSVARSLSVSTSAINGSGRSSSDLGWGNPPVSKSTWSTQNPASPADDMWTKPLGTRPPPGFNKNINRSMSMPQGPSDKSAFSPVGSGWDSQNSLGSGSTWLVLRNLTPQIDGATLKTLCSQHGPLLNFFVNQNNGQALVQYATRLEGQKAHKSLNSCVLGNTTIMTEFVDESEVQRIIDQCQRQGNIARSQSLSTAPGSAMWPNTNNNSSSSSNLWGGSMAPGSATSAGSTTWGGLGSGLVDIGNSGGNHF